MHTFCHKTPNRPDGIPKGTLDCKSFLARFSEVIIERFQTLYMTTGVADIYEELAINLFLIILLQLIIIQF